MRPRPLIQTTVILIFWTMFALLVAGQTYISMLDHGHSPLRIAGYYCLVWWVWVAITPIVQWLVERVPLVPMRTRNVLIHLGAALVASIVHMAVWSILSILIRPFDAMTTMHFGSYLGSLTLTRLPLELLIYFGVAAVAHAIDYRERAIELDRSLNAARLHALELQIQPHFLFNTLNAISALVRTKQNDEAVQVIAGLSDLLRYTLDHAGAQRVPLEQEAEMLRRYLEIQQVRFADRLEVRIVVADEVLHAAVPTLILQPLAENAIRHGLSQSASPGIIDVRAFRENDRLRIEMFNTGAIAGNSRAGIGLTNTRERLQQLYGDSQSFDLRQTATGVLATISIPWSAAP
ncbi:MAG TPA: histidine kinase [Thermoanaerobaculia bacterium]|nr:histidine kinase [Thermoanaerobaculia bacterium]